MEIIDRIKEYFKDHRGRAFKEDNSIVVILEGVNFISLEDLEFIASLKGEFSAIELRATDEDHFLIDFKI